MRNAFLTGLLVVISTLITLGAGEAILRIKNASMRNYDIEMWRYAKELKVRSESPLLGHEHVPSSSAKLQSVDIRINERGLRGEPLALRQPGKRRILFLGSSVTLGWGVPEENVVTTRLARMFLQAGQDVEVLNAGIGNYNAARYVDRFITRLADLDPTDIVVHYFVRDAEVIDVGGGNMLLRNSQLAVTSWVAANRYFGKESGLGLEEHYKNVYLPQAPGFLAMQEALHRLSVYAATKNIRIYLAMTPDVHDLVDYRFGFIHDTMSRIAKQEGYVYVDLLPAMRNLTPKELWSMPGDPHPNSLGHQRMAEAIFPSLRISQ